MRNALLEKQVITLSSETTPGQTRTFEIDETIGSGFSCIAYRAIDSGNKISVVIKECFPYKSAIRELNGNVIWTCESEEKRALERFRKAFETQRELQSSPDTMNTSVHLIDGLYGGNNTLYTITDLQNCFC